MTDRTTASTAEEQDAALMAQMAEELGEKSQQEPEDGQAEAGAAETAPETEEPAGKPRTVPHQALHAEREEHKKTRAALEEERRQRAADMARLEERLRIIQGVNQPQEQPATEPDIPDPNKDPIGFLNWQREQALKAREQGKQTEAQRAQETERQRFTSDYVAAIHDYGGKQADFKDAYDFAMQSRAAELRLFGATEEQVRQQLENDELSLAWAAVQSGVHPGERIMEFAKSRGWAKKAPAPDPAAAVERIAAGQKAGKSLSQVGGAPAGGEMTAEALLKMSNEEFFAWTEKNPAKAKRLLGA